MHKNCAIFRLLSLSLSLSWICTLEYVSRITITNFPRKQEISKAFPRTEKINKTDRRNFIISIFTRLKSTKYSPSSLSRRHLAGRTNLGSNETRPEEPSTDFPSPPSRMESYVATGRKENRHATRGGKHHEKNK